MLYLLLTSCIWAFSFGLIGNHLAGLEPSTVACVRLALSFLVFLPFAGGVGPRFPLAAKLLLLGAVQFGMMYILYITSFNFLPSHSVALYTVFTPIHVAILANLKSPRRAGRPLLAAAIAVAGTAIVNWKTPNADRMWLGFALVQGSNLCFAVGQLRYRRVMQSPAEVSDHQAMTWMYAGALMLSIPFALTGYRAHGFAPTAHQIWILLYLGIVASGVGFWLWNIGARRVRRAATLAVMNNAKIPLGMAISLLLFKEQAPPERLLLAGGAMLLALLLCEWPIQAPHDAAA